MHFCINLIDFVSFQFVPPHSSLLAGMQYSVAENETQNRDGGLIDRNQQWVELLFQIDLTAK